VALALVLLAATASPVSALPFQQAAVSSAARVAAQLSTPSSTIKGLTDYNARSDPDGLLGLPGQYIARADFNVSNEISGPVEVFATSSDRARRQQGLGPGAQAAYIWNGRVLLRLFGSPSTWQLQAYRDALNDVYLP